ncbi:dienelactone hydrolase family protein [Maricaulis sp.]|uniref:dienelactone hydrolase family protein n=1 Tax=Maricaulis sp. TaxID=1486257 RepID=UPI003A9278A4
MMFSFFLRAIPAALAIAATGLGAYASSNASGFGVPQRTLQEQAELLRPFTDIRIPEMATGPVPAVLMFHGCDGLRQVQEDYARSALDAGYGVLIIGSNAARGIDRFAAMSQVCTGLRLWGRERAADVFAGLYLAREDSRIDASRLALIGWSHGGWTVLEALDDAGRQVAPEALEHGLGPVPDLAGVRTAMTLYPYCGFPMRSNGREYARDIPLHAILAENDMIAPPGDCERLFERSETAGHRVDVQVWQGLTHAFDEPNPPPDPRINFDIDAAEQARSDWLETLSLELAP